MPIYLTKACASIGYFPEWIITGIVLTDTSTLGRYYDQSEWSHAFGVTSLGVPVPVAAGDADRLYRWWYGPNSHAGLAGGAGDHPAASSSSSRACSWPGPTSRPTRSPPGCSAPHRPAAGPTSPLDAYGYQGAAPLPSYSSPADYTFLWYDATAKGPDEEGVNGTGLMRYVNGGMRYKAGTVPAGPVPMFSVAGSVTSYASPPDLAPSYPAWPGSPPRGRSDTSGPGRRHRRPRPPRAPKTGASPSAGRPVAAFSSRRCRSVMLRCRPPGSPTPDGRGDHHDRHPRTDQALRRRRWRSTTSASPSRPASSPASSAPTVRGSPPPCA